jgi:L-iditol 2-dehydrogenase
MKVYACSICGTDPRVIRDGWPGMPPFGSFIPGHEYSGQIVAIGPGVTDFAIGDRVAIESHKGCGHCVNCKQGRYTICLNYGKPETGHRHYGFTANGGYAQYAVNHVSTLYHISDSVAYEEAALVTTAACVHFALDNVGGLLGGETVAVLGPGPIGLMGVQLVKALGATKVILTGTRYERLSVGKALGADVIVNIHEQDAAGWEPIWFWSARGAPRRRPRPSRCAAAARASRTSATPTSWPPSICASSSWTTCGPRGCGARAWRIADVAWRSWPPARSWPSP